jgi:hypothetical protein
MVRIQACAIINKADKPEKIDSVAIGKGVDTDTAAFIYTLGEAKYLVRKGLARNYADAVEILEDRQSGVSRNPLTVTESAEATAREIARINQYNNTGNTAVYKEGFVVDSEGNAEKTRFFIGVMESVKTARKHSLNIGKVLGTLYTKWEEKEAENKPDNIAHTDYTGETVRKNLELFFTEYKARLSKIAQRHLHEVIDYKGDAKDITSASARNDPDKKQLYKTVDNLFYNFPHKDAITRPQFVDMVRDYLQPSTV